MPIRSDWPFDAGPALDPCRLAASPRRIRSAIHRQGYGVAGPGFAVADHILADRASGGLRHQALRFICGHGHACWVCQRRFAFTGRHLRHVVQGALQCLDHRCSQALRWGWENIGPPAVQSLSS